MVEKRIYHIECATIIVKSKQDEFLPHGKSGSRAKPWSLDITAIPE